MQCNTGSRSKSNLMDTEFVFVCLQLATLHEIVNFFQIEKTVVLLCITNIMLGITVSALCLTGEKIEL